MNFQKWLSETGCDALFLESISEKDKVSVTPIRLHDSKNIDSSLSIVLTWDAVLVAKFTLVSGKGDEYANEKIGAKRLNTEQIRMN